MKIAMCEQGSPQWWEAKRGIPSASNFSRIITSKTCKLSAQAEEYICELVGDKLGHFLPPNIEHFTNRATRWGEECEAQARAWYAMDEGAEVTQVGVCFTDDGRFCASPDGLVSISGQYEGSLELKCPMAKTHTAYLLKPERLLDDYRQQVHGQLLVTGLSWCDLLSYAPGFEPVKLRVEPDDYTKKLAEALEGFWTQYQESLAKIHAQPVEMVPANEEWSPF
jgi:hypothetical protein